jgi:ribonuclease HI
MNVDAAFCADTGEAAAGVVFRNHSGEPIAAASSVLEGCNDAEEAEAIAVWTGMKLAVQLNLKPAIVESDNAGVVKVLNGIAPHLGTNWHIYRNILHYRKTDLWCPIYSLPSAKSHDTQQRRPLPRYFNNTHGKEIYPVNKFFAWIKH